MNRKEQQYESPLLEIIEFQNGESIASSGVGFYEELWSGE